MSGRMYIVRGHFQPFWYKKHITMDGLYYTKTLVLMNVGLQWWTN